MTFIARALAFIGGLTVAAILANLLGATDFASGFVGGLFASIGALSFPRS